MNMIKGGMPPEIERYILGWKDIQMDGRALFFTLLAAVLSGVLAGLAPAWQCSRPNLTDALKEGGRGGSSGGARHRLRNILVGAEVTLAVVLLAGAGLMVRGFGSLVDNGRRFDPATLLTLRLALTDNKYHEPHRQVRFYESVLERISALPGVQSATAVSAMPYSNHSNGRAFTIEGRPVDRDKVPTGMYQLATPSYFETVHIPLRAGRLLASTDGPDAPKVAVISQRMADRWWKGESPIGRRIRHRGAGFAARPLAHDRGSGGRHDAQPLRPRAAAYRLRALRPGAGAVDGHRSAHGRRPAAAGAGDHGGHPLGGPANSRLRTCRPWRSRFTIAPSA